MKQRMRISFYVEAEQKARLDRLAVKLDRPWAELLREAIDQLLGNKDRPAPGPVGLRQTLKSSRKRAK